MQEPVSDSDSKGTVQESFKIEYRRRRCREHDSVIALLGSELFPSCSLVFELIRS